ncbi:amidase [Pseudomonadota bacterium]
MNPFKLTASEAALRIAKGELTSETLVSSCLSCIAEVDANIKAWTYLDPDYALEQAKSRDSYQQSGQPTGPLHGVPVGIKDIFDTADMPTENGTVLCAGRQPDADAKIVSLLREAGAVILGKTVTTECAVHYPGKTLNPHDPTRTPGGSSSGSAAGVAASMMPLAIGSQTNGSVIRPASFCGIYGFKPTHGRISRRGVLLLSRALDVVGGFARSVDDLALLVDSLFAFDERDADMHMRGKSHLIETVAEQPPLSPKIAFIKTPVWERTDANCQTAFTEMVDALGDNCEEVTLPDIFDRAIEFHKTIMNADLALNLASLYDRGKDQLSGVLQGLIEDGQKTLAVDYNHSLHMVSVLYAELVKVLQKYDAILTPATTGEAPVGLGSTGDPIFCTLWSLLGTPAVTLPILKGANGMPIGAQLIGARFDDARLLRTARWLDQLIGK